ncbi:PAS domain-containing protein [Tychonema sp. BBK16]|uniref:PAS domain-containing protein n=2 Tax=Tychonema sp. BBK16 TaxID=2699888 RepID=UPI001F48A187|nr:PAS domain-containing protein [Tychonema sp. BBK16]MCF6374991.1 PAS domain-containing protein [Tychonema sp. BBK16]
MNMIDRKKIILKKNYAENTVLQPNILLVDDSPEILHLFSVLLSKLGYKVRPTRDGKLALKYAKKNPPDLILLDIMMPEIDGYQVCEKLKACEQTKDIPVIFISALNEVIDKLKAFSMGGVDYITKPFQLEEVVARIESQLLLRRLSKQVVAQNLRLQAEIEERKQIEAQLRESQRWLSALITANPNILYVYDLIEERSLYINREIYSDIGYTFEEIQQMEAAFISKLIHPDDFSAFSAHMQKMEQAKDGESLEFEYRLQHKNGGYCWFLSRDTVFIRTEDGKPWKILGTAIEISSRKQAELERKTDLASLERLIKQRFLLETITLEIRYNLNPDQVCQTAAAQIGRVFNADCCLIHTYIEDPIPDISCIAHYKKLGVESVSFLDLEIPVSGNPHVGFILSQDKAVVSDNVATEPLLESVRNLVEKINLKSMIAIRTSYQGKANGIIALHQYDSPRNWTQDEIRLFASVAAQMGIAMAQSNLLQQDKQQRIQLQKSEASLAAAQKIAHIGSWEFDVFSEKITWSEEIFCIFGLDPTQCEPTHIELLEMYYPEDRDCLDRTLKLAISEGFDYKKEFRILHTSGQVRYTESRGSSIFNETGEVIKLFGTIMDITDRKQGEVALRTSEQREREKAQQLKQTLKELKGTQTQLIQAEKMSSIGQMVAGVAHEINNPISFIYGNINPAARYAKDLVKTIHLYQRYYPEPFPEIAEKLEEIDADFIGEDFPKIMASMQEGANRIKQIVLSLRNFSRLDEKDSKAVDIHEGIESTLVILQHRLKEQPKRAEIQIIKDYGQLPEIQCYPAQINQVFMNVLSNAIDALEDSAVNSNGKAIQILITTEVASENRVCVRIADNGLGISSEVQSRIFDPFFTTKPVGRGTGLGLSISYQIVKDRHGGELSCYSELGKGTEFAIEVPISQNLKVKS